MAQSEPDLDCFHPRNLVKPEYVSAGCSRTVGSLSWGQNGLLAFGSHNMVAIYSLQVVNLVGNLHTSTRIWF